MKEKASVYLLFLLLLTSNTAMSQDLNLLGRANIGIGFDYLTQDFNGLNTRYSPGGGIGLEVGMEGEINNDLFWYGTVGITFNLNLHYEEVMNMTRRTSFSWNKKYFTGGVNKYFELRNKYFKDFYGGGGLLLSFPGTLRRTENGTGNGNSGFLGRIKYNPALGFQLHSGTTLTIFDGFLLRPEIRYRFINYNSKSFTKGDIDDLPPGLKKANGQGIDISVTLVKQIRSRRR